MPTVVAEPNKLSAYTYDARGNLTGQSDLPTSDATGAQAFSASPAGPAGVIAPGTVVDVVFVNDGVTVVNGVRTEDRNLIVESLSVGGAAPMLPTDSGVTVDQGDGTAAFDGIDTLPGQTGLWIRFLGKLRWPGTGLCDSRLRWWPTPGHLRTGSSRSRPMPIWPAARAL